MMLFCAAIGWSFIHGIAWSQSATSLLHSGKIFPSMHGSPTEDIVQATTQAAGLTLFFTLIVVTSAILFLANLELSSTSYRSTSDEAQPDEPD
jgi:hypothetical protein